MKRKQTFYLTLGTTLSIAVFGIVSAIYTEYWSARVDVNIITVDSIALAVFSSITALCFSRAYDATFNKKA